MCDSNMNVMKQTDWLPGLDELMGCVQTELSFILQV